MPSIDCEPTPSSSSSATPESSHRPGDAFECLSIPVEIAKVPMFDENGNVKLDENGKHMHFCGFSIGGGMDQDHRLSPQKYPDNVNALNFAAHCSRSTTQDFSQKGIYVTSIKENGPAAKSNLRVNDKVLQVNGVDFTMVTHKQAVETIKKGKNLYILVSRTEDGAN